jgi:uncharacterized protein
MRKVLVWNKWNIDHIAKHGVRPDEARYILEHAKPPYPQKMGEGKYVVKGQTGQGRYLQVIFIELGDDEVDIELLDLVDRFMFEEGNEVFYVIHARDLTPREKRRL